MSHSVAHLDFSASFPPRRWARARRGATAVELSLILPVLLLMVFGGIEFARLNIIRHVAANASYEACRYVVVPGATVAEAQGMANQMLSALGVKNATITVTPNPILETTGKISVQVDIPVTGNFWFLPRFSSGNTITVVSSLLSERPPLVQSQALAASASTSSSTTAPSTSSPSTSSTTSSSTTASSSTSSSSTSSSSTSSSSTSSSSTSSSSSGSSSSGWSSGYHW